jgi:Trypsin-co-occurring domain 2
MDASLGSIGVVMLVLVGAERRRTEGTSANQAAVVDAIERIFVEHADLLRFPGMHVTYTVPPWLQLRMAGLACDYDGIEHMTCMTVRRGDGEPVDATLAMLRELVAQRGDWTRVFGSVDDFNVARARAHAWPSAASAQGSGEHSKGLGPGAAARVRSRRQPLRGASARAGHRRANGRAGAGRERGVWIFRAIPRARRVQVASPSMADDLTEDLGKNIPLSEMIESLRQELAAAMAKGQGQDLRFEVGSAELEVELVAKRSKAGEAGVKFWVVTAKGQVSAEDAVTHRFKLSLTPKRADGGAVEVSRSGAR